MTTRNPRPYSRHNMRIGVARVALVGLALAGLSLATDHGTDTPAPVVNAAPVVAWPTAGERIHEEDPRFDCRVDGDRHCGPSALVPVPDPVTGMRYVSIFDAPYPPVWRAY